MPPKKGTRQECDENADNTDALSDAYGLPIPAEVALLYELATQLNPKSPLEAFSSLGVRLVGPFEVLKGVLTSGADLHMHWRYQYDPPEVMTVMTDASTNRPSKHWCYHRDDPGELPGMVVLGRLDSYEFEVVGATLVQLLLDLSKQQKDTKLSGMLKAVLEDSKQKLESVSAVKKQRAKKSIAQPLSKLGMVCPFNKKTEVGYRKMSCTVTELKKLITKSVDNTATEEEAEELASISQFVDIANDECDFGHGLEVGLNYLSLVKPGSAALVEAARILDLAYMLLDRAQFQKTAAALFDFRSKKSHPPVSKVYPKAQ